MNWQVIRHVAGTGTVFAETAQRETAEFLATVLNLGMVQKGHPEISFSYQEIFN